jgi:uncharacterized protein DUF3619
MNDRESELARGITKQLDRGLDTIDPLALARLRSAREIAVATLQRQPALALAPNSASGARAGVLHYFYPRYIVPLAALVLAIMGTVYWQQSQQNDDVTDIDAKLLSGDLPIDAYLDKGLDSWLKRTSQ